MAFRDAKANIFHTLLSVLGVVIGVAALVGILSLIDGMEQYAHQQITETTSLESILIIPVTSEKVDNVRITKEDYAHLDYAHFNKLLTEVGGNSKGYMLYRESGYLNVGDSTKKRGVLFSGIIDTWKDDLKMVEGVFISKNNLVNKDSVILLNDVTAAQMTNDNKLSTLLNTTVTYDNGNYQVIGIIHSTEKEPVVYVPITLIPELKIKAKPPTCVLIAETIEDLPRINEDILSWIQTNYKGSEDDFRIITNEYRVKQANQGFLMFRIVMGMIVGISVLVGGIGVMNVLLISVTERTAEIGVRKAVGAKKKT